MNQNTYKIFYKAITDSFGEDSKGNNINDVSLTEVLQKAAGDDGIEVHKEEIRNAILHFYSTKGVKAFVFFRGGTIQTKTRIVDLENNLYVNALASEFQEIFQTATMSSDIKGVSFIAPDMTKSLLAFLSNIEEVEQKKEIIKSALKKILELGPRDALFFMSDKIMIKKFVGTEKKKEGPVRRSFDHIPQEALEYIETEMRKKGLDDKIQVMLREMFKDELNFRKIDNFYFAKNFIRLLQEKFVKFLSPYLTEESEENVIAFSNYILRKDFDKLLASMAKELIRLLLEKDSNAEVFIKFYNGDTAFASNGKRFQKPDIKDDRGGRWNNSTIFQVGLQRKKGLETIKEAKEAIIKTQGAIKKFEADLESSEALIEKKKNMLNEVAKQYQEYNAGTAKNKEQIHELKTAMTKEKEAEKQQALQEQISQLSIEVKNNFKHEEENLKQKKKLENEVEKQQISNTILKKDLDAYRKKLDNNAKKLEELLKNQEPLDEKYNTIVHALAKTLSSFRGA